MHQISSSIQIPLFAKLAVAILTAFGDTPKLEFSGIERFF
jgi:hypothetical protein